MDFISVPDGLSEVAFRLVVATLLGAALGINRELFLKPAGLRTHALVCLGAALATLVSLLLTAGSGADPSAPGRVIQGIVAGIGFIGGGVILHLNDTGTVKGLTTAASIWVVSVTGVAVGAGLWRTAIIVIALALLVLIVGREIDRALHHGTSIND